MESWSVFNLDPASTHAHIAQSLDPYSDICSLRNRNKDSTRSLIRSTNQYLALCKYDYLQDLGLTLSANTMSESTASNMKLSFQDLGWGITCIETHYQRPGLASCYLLQHGDEAVLIDTGTAFTTPNILELLKQKGISREQVRYVIPTHVHLDHAGGAGQLIENLPQARLLIHPYGARHMIDPTKLQAGTIAVYGEEEFAREYGELRPIAAERVIEATDGWTVELGGRQLLCIDTPGHARHHFCIWDELSRGFFSGDTFGIAYPELASEKGPFMLLPSTPVQFDPDTWHRTLDLLMEYRPERMFLTHYCAVEKPASLVDALHQELDDYVQIALSCQHAERRQEALEQSLWSLYRQRLSSHGCNLEQENIDALIGADMALCAQGLEVWLQRREKE